MSHDANLHKALKFKKVCEDSSVMGCEAISLGEYYPTFRSIVVHYNTSKRRAIPNTTGTYPRTLESSTEPV